jgi:hypothetical protein
MNGLVRAKASNRCGLFVPLIVRSLTRSVVDTARKSRARSTIAIASFGSLTVILLVSGVTLLGGLDWLAADGHVNRSLGAALVVQWLLFWAIVWVFRNAIARPREMLLAAASVAAAICVLEFICRALVPSARALQFAAFRSSEFHHIYPPNSRMFIGLDGREAYLETNADGLRTAYTPESFAAHDTRVIALGDSFTLGISVQGEKAYPVRLETLLRSSVVGSVALLNAGIASYSPFTEKSYSKSASESIARRLSSLC